MAQHSSLISDDTLRQDDRSPDDLRKALLADTIIRLARLQGLGRFTRMEDALAAVGAAQAARAAGKGA